MASSITDSRLGNGIRIPRQRSSGPLRPKLRRQGDPAGTSILPAIAVVTDLVSLCLAVTATELSLALLPINQGDAEPVFLVAAPVMIFGWVAAITACGGYQRSVLGAGTDEYRRVFNASLVAAAVVGIGCYLGHFPLARGFFVMAGIAGVSFVLAGRVAMRATVRTLRRRGALVQRVLVVGERGHVKELSEVLQRESWLGLDVIGSLFCHADAPSGTDQRLPGQARRVAARARALRCDVVLLAGGAFDSSGEMRRLAWELENEDVQVVIAPSVTDVSSERVRVRPVGGLPLIHLEKPRSTNALRRAKRSFDVLGAVGLLLLLAPVIALAAAWIRWHDGGRVLFVQTRVGRDGERFRLLKFRSMVTNAEQLLDELHEQQGHSEGLFKMAKDPRVTGPGRVLRRYSLDEIPQLLNVLRGDMSLVGPRPPLVHEAAQYDDDMRRRLRVRPGLTGLWQVSGRSELSWDEAIRLDLYYVDNWSMLQDLTILARTLGAVVRPRGAY